MVWAAASTYVDADETSERAAALQAVAALTTLLATVVLVAVTAWYAVLTKGILQRSGPIIGVTLRSAWAMGNHSAVTAPFDLTAQPFDKRYNIPLVAVGVTNSGNASITVNDAAVEVERAFSLSELQSQFGPSTPLRLDGNSATTFYIPLEPFVQSLSALKPGEGKRVRGTVSLGDGTRVASDWVDLRR